jgi:hypothetical protein
LHVEAPEHRLATTEMIIVGMTDQQTVDAPVTALLQVGNDHGLAAIQAVRKRRARVVDQHVAAGFQHGGQPLADIQQGQPQITLVGTPGLQRNGRQHERQTDQAQRQPLRCQHTQQPDGE